MTARGDASSDKSTEAVNFMQLQCQLACERLHQVHLKDLLAETRVQLHAEKIKSKNLVKIVNHLEDVLREEKVQFEDRVLVLQKTYETELKRIIIEWETELLSAFQPNLTDAAKDHPGEISQVDIMTETDVQK